jgi:hypothetical protein
MDTGFKYVDSHKCLLHLQTLVHKILCSENLKICLEF